MKIRVKTDWQRGNILGLINRVTKKDCSTTDDIFTSEYVIVDIRNGTVADRVRLRNCGYVVETIDGEVAPGATIKVRSLVPRFMDTKAIVTAVLNAVNVKDISFKGDRVYFEIIDATEAGLQTLADRGFDIEVLK